MLRRILSKVGYITWLCKSQEKRESLSHVLPGGWFHPVTLNTSTWHKTHWWWPTRPPMNLQKSFSKLWEGTCSEPGGRQRHIRGRTSDRSFSKITLGNRFIRWQRSMFLTSIFQAVTFGGVELLLPQFLASVHLAFWPRKSQVAISRHLQPITLKSHGFPHTHTNRNRHP